MDADLAISCGADAITLKATLPRLRSGHTPLVVPGRSLPSPMSLSANSPLSWGGERLVAVHSETVRDWQGKIRKLHAGAHRTNARV